MKIRNGFVSNSSSSSFVMVGVRVSALSDDDIKKLEDGGCWQDNYEYPVAVGKKWRGDEYETESMSIAEISSASDEIKKILGRDVDVELFFGMVYDG